MNTKNHYLLTLDYSYPLILGERSLAFNLSNVLRAINPSFKVICSKCNIKMNGSVVIQAKNFGVEYLDTIAIINTFKKDNIEEGIIHFININYTLALPLIFKIRKITKKKIKLLPYFYMLQHVKHLVGPRGYMKSNFAPRFVSKFSDLAIATSPYILNQIKRLGIKNVYHILPPVNCDIFKPMDKENARKSLVNILNTEIIFDQYDLTLLYMGHLFPERFPYHEILFTLKVLKRYGLNIMLIIIAPEYNKNSFFAERIKQLTNNFQLHHQVIVKSLSVKEEDKPIFYNSADFFMYMANSPSAIDPPLTTLEALASGLPIMVKETKSSSAEFLVKKYKCGVLFKKYTELNNVLLKYKNNSVIEKFKKKTRELALKYYCLNATKKRIRNLYTLLNDNDRI